MENFDIDKWIADSINDRDINDYLYDLYQNSPSHKADVRRGFKKFAETTGLKTNKNLRVVLYSSFAIAFASVAIAMFLLFESKPVAVKWTSLTTVAGETRDLLLSDGTSLHVGPCSTILYPDLFIESERKIYAIGDVYFNVTHNEDIPFIASSNGMDVKVHGTKFHLYSFPGLDDQEVALAQGSVSVTFGDDEGEVFLGPGEMLKYNKGSKLCMKTTFDAESFDDQMLGTQIFFNNENLATIAQKLSNRFGVRVIVYDNDLLDQRYYASFVNNESLAEILNVLSQRGPFSVKYVGDKYLIVK